MNEDERGDAFRGFPKLSLLVQAKEYLAAEDVRITAERAALDVRAQQIQAQTFRLMQDQNASNEVMRRRHQSHLPPDYEVRNLSTHLVQRPVTRQRQTGW